MFAFASSQMKIGFQFEFLSGKLVSLGEGGRDREPTASVNRFPRTASDAMYCAMSTVQNCRPRKAEQLNDRSIGFARFATQSTM